MTCNVGNIDLDKVTTNIDSILKDVRESIASELASGSSLIELEAVNKDQDRDGFSMEIAKQQIMGKR